MSVTAGVSIGISLFQTYLGGRAKRKQLEAQASATYENASAMRAQSNENIRRTMTSLLQTPKELRRRKDIIRSQTAGQGVRVDSSDDLVLSEAGNLIQEVAFQIEESVTDHLIQMKSADSMDRQAGELKDASKEKILGIF